MKTIDIKKQPRLGLGKTASLTMNGIRYRLFRSVVTMTVITVAIAFLMNSLTEGVVKRAMSQVADERIARQRLATQWVARLSRAATLEDILHRAATAQPEDPWYQETRKFGGFSDAQMKAFTQDAAQASVYLKFFARLNYDDRRQLVHTATGVQIFDRLQKQESYDRFSTELDKMLSIQFVTEKEQFQAFCGEWPTLLERTKAVRAGHQAAVKQIAGELGETSLLAALAEQSPDFLKAVREAGFVYSDKTAEAVGGQARELLIHKTLEKRMTKHAVKTMVSAELNTTPDKVTQKTLWHKLLKSRSLAAWTLKLLQNQWQVEAAMERAAVKQAIAAKLGKDQKALDADDVLKKLMREEDGDFAKWFHGAEEIKSLNVSIDLEPPAAVAIAARKREIEKLLEAERKCADVGDGMMGVGKRMGWLLLVSLIVCTVGIANAMLMTVTERFREIATLKCLGALDGFIMVMFVIEACVLGFFGGILGAILGIFIGLLRMRGTFGWVVWWAVRPMEILLTIVAAIVVGVILAAVAAIYPSLKASRLAPMEAMRIE